MNIIGIPSLSLEILKGVDGECSLCDFELLMYDETYVFSSEKEPIAAYHKNCFWHMAVVMRKHFEEFGLPKLDDNSN